MAAAGPNPNVNSFVETLKRADIPGGDASGEELSAFLRAVKGAATASRTGKEKEMIVFTKEVAYLDFTHRHNRMAQEANARDENGVNEWKNEMKEWGTCMEAVWGCKARGINVWLVASHPNVVWEKSWDYLFGGKAEDEKAKEEHYARRTDWHAYAVKLEDQKVWIYDPSYGINYEERKEGDGDGDGKRRLHQFPFMKRGWDLVRSIRRKGLKVGGIFIGGGENWTGICQDMACEWIRGEVLGYVGEEWGRIEVNNWEEIVL